MGVSRALQMQTDCELDFAYKSESVDGCGLKIRKPAHFCY